MTPMMEQNACEVRRGVRQAETVEAVFSQRIEEARKNVERLCIAKAKAEALNLHKFPYSELVDILHIW